jgi:hypothetical protein
MTSTPVLARPLGSPERAIYHAVCRDCGSFEAVSTNVSYLRGLRSHHVGANPDHDPVVEEIVSA